MGPGIFQGLLGREACVDESTTVVIEITRGKVSTDPHQCTAVLVLLQRLPARCHSAILYEIYLVHEHASHLFDTRVSYVHVGICRIAVLAPAWRSTFSGYNPRP